MPTSHAGLALDIETHQLFFAENPGRGDDLFLAIGMGQPKEAAMQELKIVAPPPPSAPAPRTLCPGAASSSWLVW